MLCVGWGKTLSKREYIAVVYDHDTKKWDLDLDLIVDLTGNGDVYDTVTDEWEWVDSLGAEGVNGSMERIRELGKLIRGEDKYG